MNIDRRTFLKAAGAIGAGSALFRSPWTFGADATPPALVARPRLVKFPEKTDLIFLTDRPPQLETPVKYFAQDLTPNEAFFVRWHLSGIPTSVDPKAFRLSVGGHVATPAKWSLEELRSKFKPVETVAVCQCSGNSRGLFEPRVAGGQWGHGAMGNARWRGVKLKDLLDAAGMKAGAVDVSFMGLDRPPMPDTPVFAKSLEAARAMDGETIVAYEMNGKALPMLNGYPLRLVVPGWYATYWVKSLNEITVWNEKFKSFWMDKAYRIPNNATGNENPKQLATDTVPISTMSLRSVFVTPAKNAQLRTGKETEVQGVAFDGGNGIAKVEVSADGGKSWAEARMERSLGNYSWRRWRYFWTPTAAGTTRLMCRATSNSGETQGTYLWNRSGYRRNVIEHLDVNVVAEGGRA